MGKAWINYPVMFILLVGIQILLLNQVQLSGYLNPYIYVLFILLLPVSLERYLVLILSFLLGITIDIFTNSLGLHAAASVFMGFFRTPVINILSTRESEQSDFPGIIQKGLRWFLFYSLSLVFIHHFVLFYLEVFSFVGFFRTLLRIVASTLFTFVMIVLSQFLIFRD